MAKKKKTAKAKAKTKKIKPAAAKTRRRLSANENVKRGGHPTGAVPGGTT